MQKIKLTALEHQLILEGAQTSEMLITILAIFVLRISTDNRLAGGDGNPIRAEMDDLNSYVDALQRHEHSRNSLPQRFDKQVMDMTLRLQLPEKVLSLFKNADFDASIDYDLDLVEGIRRAYLPQRLADFKIKTGIDIRLTKAGFQQ
jgi:hypothetical protein